MPILDQQDQWFIPLLQSLGYVGDEEGMCFGMSQMSMQAALCNEIDKFNDRLAILYEYYQSGNIQTLKQDIDLVRERLKALGEMDKKSSQLSDHDHKLLEIAAFFEGIQLYQLGHTQFKETLGLDTDKEYNWRAVAKHVSMSLLTPDKLLANEGRIETAGQFESLYSKENLKKMFMNVMASVDAVDFPISIVLNAHNHAMSISFDPDSSHWVLLDANRLPMMRFEFDDVSKLVNTIDEGFALTVSSIATQPAVIIADIYVHNDNTKSLAVADFKADLKKQLKQKPTLIDRIELKISRLERLIEEAADRDDKQVLAKLYYDCARLERRLQAKGSSQFSAALQVLSELQNDIMMVAKKEIDDHCLLKKDGIPKDPSFEQQQSLQSFILIKKTFLLDVQKLYASTFKPVSDNPLLENKAIVKMVEKLQSAFSPPVSSFDLPVLAHALNQFHEQVLEVVSGEIVLQNAMRFHREIDEKIQKPASTTALNAVEAQVNACTNMIGLLEEISTGCQEGSELHDKLMGVLEEFDSSKLAAQSTLLGLIADKLQSIEKVVTDYRDGLQNGKTPSLDVVFMMARELKAHLMQIEKVSSVLSSESQDQVRHAIEHLKVELKAVKLEAHQLRKEQAGLKGNVESEHVSEKRKMRQ